MNSIQDRLARTGQKLRSGIARAWHKLHGTVPIGSEEERQALSAELTRYAARAERSGSQLAFTGKRTTEEQELLHGIREETQRFNRNNLTRTEAYLHFYQRHPEVHWALLAHFVSRNGGWNMTDLKAETVARLLTDRETEDFFHFLERSNWLIFQDAYPQLLLYEHCKRLARPLFHLLPAFHVSSFMQAMWSYFWQSGNPALITHALIINEQQYIERPVVQHPYYRKQVFQRRPFILQALFHFNHVLFPYRNHEGAIRLIGTSVEHFPQVEKRIRVGKKLYAILFAQPSRRKRLEQWAQSHTHSGSRADYWPHLFSPDQSQNDRGTYHAQLNGQHVHQRSEKRYSPRLLDVWPEAVRHDSPTVQDWYRPEDTEKWLNELWRMEKAEANQMTKKHRRALNKLEAAIVAKQTWEKLT